MKLNRGITPFHLASPARYSYEQKIPLLFSKFILPEDKRVLDVGCGSGEYRFFFTDKEYYGFDIQDHGFSDKYSEGTNFIIADATKIPFKDEFSM